MGAGRPARRVSFDVGQVATPVFSGTSLISKLGEGARKVFEQFGQSGGQVGPTVAPVNPDATYYNSNPNAYPNYTPRTPTPWTTSIRDFQGTSGQDFIQQGLANSPSSGLGKLYGGDPWNTPMQGPPQPSASEWARFRAEQLAAEMAAKQAELDAARDLEAWAAASSYDVDLRILQNQIDQYTAYAANNDAVWNQWREQAVGAIADAAAATAESYAQYVNLLNQGYSDFDALAQSRFAEYQADVHSKVQEFMDTTSTRYEDLMSELPGIWQPAVDAIVQGNTIALGDIAAETEAAKDSIEGQLIASNEDLRAELERIGANNPALEEELMADMIEDTQLALDFAEQTGDSLAAAQAAGAAIAENVVNTQLASSLRAAEEQRLTTVNEFARQRQKLIDASEEELRQILESSGVSRTQAIINAEADLDRRLLGLDEARIEAIMQAERGRENMAFSIGNTLQDLIDRRYRTSNDRYITTTLIDRKYEAAELWPDLDSSTQALAVMFEHIDSRSDLTQRQRDAVSAQLAGAFEEGAISTEQDLQRFLEDANAAGTLPLLWDESLNSLFKEAGRVMLDQERSRHSVRRFRRPAFYGDITPDMIGDQLDADRYNQDGSWRPHNGVDVRMAEGTPLTATVGGRIEHRQSRGGGYIVYLHGNDGLLYKYMHLREGSPYATENGQVIEAGDVLGFSGNTGDSAAPHLHFEVWNKGQRLDPMKFLLGDQVELVDNPEYVEARRRAAEQVYAEIRSQDRRATDLISRNVGENAPGYLPPTKRGEKKLPPTITSGLDRLASGYGRVAPSGPLAPPKQSGKALASAERSGTGVGARATQAQSLVDDILARLRR